MFYTLLFNIFSFFSDIEFYFRKFIPKSKYSVKYLPSFSIFTDNINNTKQIIYPIQSNNHFFYSIIYNNKYFKFDKDYQINGNKLNSNFWKFLLNIPHFNTITLFDTKLKQHIIHFDDILVFSDNDWKIISPSPVTPSPSSL